MKLICTFVVFGFALSNSAFAACSPSVRQDPSITQTEALKVGGAVRANDEIIGCSDGSIAFAEYVAVGECLSVPIFDGRRNPIGRLLITCEAR